jgi:type IV pilus assembly protein PilX
MQPRNLRPAGAVGGRRQRGVVLLIALIVLVAMTLAGIGMMRSIDSGTLVAGNIGFREAAVATADTGVEAARAWLVANQNGLTADNPTAGYFSTRQDNLDMTGNMTEGGHDGVNWGGSDTNQTVQGFSDGTPDASGNTVFYLIHRLCSITGATSGTGQSCAVSTVVQVGSTQGNVDYTKYAETTQTQIYYRITVRVNGAKNTVSYVQAIVAI